MATFEKYLIFSLFLLFTATNLSKATILQSTISKVKTVNQTFPLNQGLFLSWASKTGCIVVRGELSSDSAVAISCGCLGGHHLR